MAGLGCIEILIVGLLIFAVLGFLISRARRQPRDASPPEDDAGW
jgi:hypothetical protein